MAGRFLGSCANGTHWAGWKAEGRRGSNGEEEERSAKIERRSRRLNEEQRRRRIVRKGLWRTSLGHVSIWSTIWISVDGCTKSCVSWCLGCFGFCEFRRISRWLGVRFLSVSLFRSFFFVSFPNLACNLVGNTIHSSPSRRFQRVREPASGSCCVGLLNLHHHGLLSFKAVQEAARL